MDGLVAFFNRNGVPAFARTASLWASIGITDFKSGNPLDSGLEDISTLCRHSPSVYRTVLWNFGQLDLPVGGYALRQTTGHKSLSSGPPAAMSGNGGICWMPSRG